jgi:hypothetical protein
MHYRVEHTIPWPIDDVSDVMLNRMKRLASYLHGVDSVEQLPSEPTVRRHQWRLERSAFPPGVSSVIPDEALGFIDELIWTGHRATFAVTPLVHPEAVSFTGWVKLIDDGWDTQVEVEGEFSLTEAARARMPEILRSRGLATLESTVVGRVRAHVGIACHAVDRLLNDET